MSIDETGVTAEGAPYQSAETFRIVPDWLWQGLAPQKRAAAVMVYIVLREMADTGTEGNFLAHASIAERSGLSVSTVQRCLTELRKAGAIEWAQRRTAKGRSTSNAYLIHSSSPDTRAGAAQSTQSSRSSRSQGPTKGRSQGPSTQGRSQGPTSRDSLVDTRGDPDSQKGQSASTGIGGYRPVAEVMPEDGLSDAEIAEAASGGLDAARAALAGSSPARPNEEYTK